MRTVRYLWMAGSFNCFTAEAQRTQGSAEKSSGNQLVVSEQSAMIETIRANAMRITELQKAVNRTVSSRHLSPAHHEAWKIACSAFHSEYEALAFPGGLEVAYDLIKGKDSSVVEPAIAFSR
jgi:hypothetical protein